MTLRTTTIAAVLISMAASVSAQTSHTIDLGSLSPDGNNVLQPGGNGFPLTTGAPALTYTTAPGVIDAAEAYTVEFVPFVTALGTPLGAFTAVIEQNPGLQPGTPFPLRGLIGQFGDFIPNVELYLFDGAIENPGGQLPTNTLVRTFDVSGQPTPGFPFKYTYTLTVNADQSITITFQDVNFSGQGPLTIVNAPFTATLPLPGIGNVFFGPSTMTIRTATLPDDVETQSEFRFDGDLRQAYGPAEIMYFDDPRFSDQPGNQDGNPVLQFANSTIVPDPQFGFTEAQSGFGTTGSFGLPAINGESATVFQVSAPRIDAGNAYQNDRQIGLAVAPLTGADYPGSTNNVDRFSMIWDIYIPQASWNSQTPVSFLNFQQDNGTNSDRMASADFRIATLSGTSSGPRGIGINRLRVNGTLFEAANIVGNDFGPDRWMRVAITVDNDFTREAKIFVNGTKVGELGWADEIDNFIDPANPRWRVEDINDDGVFSFSTPIDTPTFVGWGNFPNPLLDFVQTQESPDRFTPETRSNFMMFSDALGEGEMLFLANYHYAEFIMTESEIADLGSSDATGIVFECPLDRDDSGGPLSIGDIQSYLSDLANLLDSANYNRDGAIDAIDLFDILNSADETGCQ